LVTPDDLFPYQNTNASYGLYSSVVQFLDYRALDAVPVTTPVSAKHPALSLESALVSRRRVMPLIKPVSFLLYFFLSLFALSIIPRRGEARNPNS